MKHKETCDVVLAEKGWHSTRQPICNCSGDVGSKNKQIYKVFRCRSCWNTFLVPLSQGVAECEHDRFNTGSAKDLIDIIEI